MQTLKKIRHELKVFPDPSAGFVLRCAITLLNKIFLQQHLCIQHKNTGLDTVLMNNWTCCMEWHLTGANEDSMST